MSLIRARRHALAGLAAAAWLAAAGLAPMPVRAASCSGASHSVSLSSGAASPASGTTGTVFTFWVAYASNAGCPPVVTVTINGVGTYGMSAAGTDYAAGVSFFASLTLPPGTYDYSFHATSGSGAGSQAVTLTSVSPAAVAVFAPAPVVEPPPETPVPTPLATESPTPSASVVSAASVTPGTTTPVPGASSGTAGMFGGWGRRTGPMPPRPHADPAAATELAGPLGGTGGLVWVTATAGGLGLFLFLNRRAPLAEGPIPSGDAARERRADAAPPPSPRRTSPDRDEQRVARWLRPSVQAARFADPYRDPYPDD